MGGGGVSRGLQPQGQDADRGHSQSHGKKSDDVLERWREPRHGGMWGEVGRGGRREGGGRRRDGARRAPALAWQRAGKELLSLSKGAYVASAVVKAEGCSSE